MNNKIYNFEKLDNNLNINDVTIVNIDFEKYDISSDEVIDKITKYSKIREIILTSKDYDSDATNIFLNFNNKIALLQNLSVIEVDFAHVRKNSIELANTQTNTTYIYNDCMTCLSLFSIENIPINIKHLNINCGINLNLINCLPEHIETIHISCTDNSCLYKMTNLPPTLKKLSLTFVANYENFIINDSIVKLPFECEFEVDYIEY